MKGLLTLALGVAVAASTFVAAIDLDTGFANWQYYSSAAGGFVPVVSVSPTVDSSGGNSPAPVAPGWAPAPSGSSLVSFSSLEATGCGGASTPGASCAAPTVSQTGSDMWYYQ